ncbi:MAG: hypothetical protein KDD15_22065, partial [Lewinella sp.]|nr:hypothetical protein [Lewinella sp.]
MNVLFDLVNYMVERKSRQIHQKDDLAAKLFRGIKNGRFSSDEAAMRSLYPEGPHRTVYYNATKRKLKNLLYHLALSTTAAEESYAEKCFTIEKKVLVARQLAGEGWTASAINIMEEALKEAMDLHLIPTARQAAFRLSIWYVATGHPAKYRKYVKLEKELATKEAGEFLAEQHYFALYNKLRNQKSIDQLLLEFSRQIHEELVAIDIETFNFRMFASYIAVLHFELSNDGEKVVETCRSALEYFAHLPFQLPNRTYRIFTTRIVPALIQQRNSTEAIQQLALAENYVNKGSLNWVGIQEYRAIAGFHLQDMAIVSQAIASIRSSRKAFAMKKEEVRILEGYLSFFSTEELSRFKVGKFVNEMPKYAADKKGMNINILIIQILIFLGRRDLPKIIDRMEALRIYAYRYLKDDKTTRRSYLFIQLLL